MDMVAGAVMDEPNDVFMAHIWFAIVNTSGLSNTSHWQTSKTFVILLKASGFPKFIKQFNKLISTKAIIYTKITHFLARRFDNFIFVIIYFFNSSPFLIV